MRTHLSQWCSEWEFIILCLSSRPKFASRGGREKQMQQRHTQKNNWKCWGNKKGNTLEFCSRVYHNLPATGFSKSRKQRQSRRWCLHPREPGRNSSIPQWSLQFPCWPRGAFEHDSRLVTWLEITNTTETFTCVCEYVHKHAYFFCFFSVCVCVIIYAPVSVYLYVCKFICISIYYIHMIHMYAWHNYVCVCNIWI